MGLLQFLTFFCILHFLPLLSFVNSENIKLETYIVHVELPNTTLNSFLDDINSFYQTFLPKATTNSEDESRMIYSYRNVFTGFAARLSPEEVKAMEKIPGFISASVEKVIPLHTTHSPNFLGLNQNMGFWETSNYGKGVIIGVIDSGINPDHPSFSDEGMPPPPAKWKRTCEFNFTACNNKLIGARKCKVGNGTPFDEIGHGTHTASTAAGNFVPGANIFGNANGTAAGIAPLAHLAIYKVCLDTCAESALLAGLDVAIDDGVDIISLSIEMPALELFAQNIVVGAFRAVQKGIFVSASAGNSGPGNGTVANGAPWILTVGASTIDRKIRATAVLGNDEELDGESAFQPMDFAPSQLSLIYPGLTASNCTPTSLSNIDVRGKIVLCETGEIQGVEKGRAVRSAGGAVMILMNRASEGYTTLAEAHVLPAVHISYANGLKVKAYINSTVNPTASISFKGTIIGDHQAPTVAFFSARGPNPPSPGILKPDVIGPGVNILAAWHVSVENLNTKSTFNMISGTSMSCPHLSGVAALLKSAHPDWSPAAIKSAIMTTADQMNFDNRLIEDETLQPANILATGSGQVNPSKASDPGLVYDNDPEEYIPYLCGLNYTNQEVKKIVGRDVNCLSISSIPEAQLNYPSFSVVLGSTKETYSRTVTNVGDANSAYSVKFDLDPGVDLSIEPSTLQFNELNQKITYNVTFSRSTNAISDSVVQGFLTWTSAKYSVRSLIVVFIV